MRGVKIGEFVIALIPNMVMPRVLLVGLRCAVCISQPIDGSVHKGGGFIVRTVCAGKPTSALQQDMDYLTSTWSKIQGAQKDKKAPSRLHNEPGLCIRLVRDGLNEEVERMVIDDKDIYDEVNTFVSSFMSDFKDRVQQYRGQDPIFDTFGVEVELGKSARIAGFGFHGVNSLLKRYSSGLPRRTSPPRSRRSRSRPHAGLAR